MGTKVAKFGGSSLATVAQIDKVVRLIEADPQRRYLVVSAPGKQPGIEYKITDLLYQAFEQRHGDYAPILASIRQRFEDIAAGLGVDVDLAPHFAQIEAGLTHDDKPFYIASRGEYLMGVMMAARLGWAFIDAADVVRFAPTGELMRQETDNRLARTLGAVSAAVVPGFYGATADGTIKTFTRGGSDVTGSLVARAVDATVYENWTDVSGLYMADPRIVPSPRSIPQISYNALRELTYLGASVLHEDAVTPVREKGIPINIRNTDRPQDEGTWIEAHAAPPQPGDPAIIGLAGRCGYTALTIRKAQLSGSRGQGTQFIAMLEQAGLVVDLVMTSVDRIALVTASAPLVPVEQDLLDRIALDLSPDAIRIRDGLALIGVVESAAVRRGEIASRMAGALAAAGIELRLFDSGVGYMHIAVVDTAQYEQAIRALYAELVEGRS